MTPDSFLKAVHDERVAVLIYLVSGVRLQGEITSVDQHAIVLEFDGAQLIYKHAIASIVPKRGIRESADVSAINRGGGHASMGRSPATP